MLNLQLTTITTIYLLASAVKLIIYSKVLDIGKQTINFYISRHTIIKFGKSMKKIIGTFFNYIKNFVCLSCISH